MSRVESWHARHVSCDKSYCIVSWRLDLFLLTITYSPDIRFFIVNRIESLYLRCMKGNEHFFGRIRVHIRSVWLSILCKKEDARKCRDKYCDVDGTRYVIDVSKSKKHQKKTINHCTNYIFLTISCFEDLLWWYSKLHATVLLSHCARNLEKIPCAMIRCNCIVYSRIYIISYTVSVVLSLIKFLSHTMLLW